MKKIILVFAIFLTQQTWAFETTNQLIPQKELQLLKLIQQMEPELLEEILSDAGVEWYIENTQQLEDKLIQDSSEDEIFDSLTQPTKIGGFGQKDTPTYN